MAECFPKKSSLVRNEQVCWWWWGGGGGVVTCFKQFNGLDAALYKNIYISSAIKIHRSDKDPLPYWYMNGALRTQQGL